MSTPSTPTRPVPSLRAARAFDRSREVAVRWGESGQETTVIRLEHRQDDYGQWNLFVTVTVNQASMGRVHALLG